MSATAVSNRGRQGCRLDPEGQADPEDAALTRLAFHPDLAAQRMDKPARDAEAEASAAGFATVGAVERDEIVEDARLVGLGDADAGIDDAEFDDPGAMVCGLGLDLDGDLCRCG